MPGILTLSTLSDGTNSTSATNVIRGSFSVWGNYTGISGATSIASSYNMSSVTRNNTGDYSVSFIKNTIDANYSFSGSVINSSFSTTADNSVRYLMPYTNTLTINGMRMFSKYMNDASSAQEDENFICFSIIN